MHIRKIAITVLAALALAGGASAVAYAAGRRAKAKAKPKTEAQASPQKTTPYHITRFKTLEVSSSIDITYTMSPTVSLTARGSEEDLKFLSVKNERGVLRITRNYPVGYRRQNYEGIEISLNAPACEKIKLKGTATLKVDRGYNLGSKELSVHLEEATRANFTGTVNARAVKIGAKGASKIIFDSETSSSTTINISGSSTCTIDSMRTGQLDATATGASKLILGGSARKAVLASSGASTIKAKGLRAGNISSSSTGASQIAR